MERQREMMQIISQETRHQIPQAILGHPEHLPSLDELDHMIPDVTGSSIEEGAERLMNEDLVTTYEVSNDAIKAAGHSARSHPNRFYGLTPEGVRVLAEFNYLSSVPVLRAVYDHTEQTEKTQRHLEGIRPDLPEAVAEALAFDELPDEELEADDVAAGSQLASSRPAETDSDESAFSELFEG